MTAAKKVLIVVSASLMVRCALADPQAIAQESTGVPQPVQSALPGSDKEEHVESSHGPTSNGSKRIKARILADAQIVDLGTDERLLPVIEIRKFQLDFTASWRQNLRHKLQVDIAGGDVRLENAYLEYGSGPAFIAIGQLKSMTSPTSLFTDGFMERAAIADAFGSGRQIGGALSYRKARWTFFAGGFRGAVTSRHTDLGRTYSSRITAVPILGEGITVHIGGKMRHRKRERDDPLFRYRGGSILDPSEWQVDTGHFADEDMLFGLELAALVRSFSIESECMLLRTSTLMARGYSRTFSGCYVAGSWFPSGETRQYDEDVFLDVDVARSVSKHGAWQVVARYDEIDLSDQAITGGGRQTLTLGLNWYMNNNVRFAANISHGRIEGGPYDGTTINALGMRLGIIW